MPDTELAALVADLRAEQESLDAVVGPLGADAWDAQTPAPRWAVRDQISHLAYFDEVATIAMVEPERFVPLAEAAVAAMTSGEDPMAEHLARGRAMVGPALLHWWSTARAGLLEAAGGLAHGTRIPWFGPPMSPMSFLSARLMETWAHGQDVVDALGVDRTPTGRLVHVAHLGVRARPFSYVVRGRAVPEAPVRVALDAPGGGTWTWSDEAVDDVVRGPALDFCLVVTQRRHLGDTALVVEGDVAKEWMSIAQAFAGPPGPGRSPAGR